MTQITCGWCRREFIADTSKYKDHGFPVLVCRHCGRLLPASKKISTGNVVGQKHIHIPYKDGDIT